MLTEPMEHPPKAFLAITYADDAASMRDGPGGQGRARVAAAMLTDTAAVWLSGRRTCVWYAGAEARDLAAEPHKCFTFILTQVSPGSVSTEELCSHMPKEIGNPIQLQQAEAMFSKITPPFAIVSCGGERCPVLAVTDFLGCQHLYWYQGDRWAAISTSSLALTCCAAAEPNGESLAARALLGFHLGDATPFAGVHKLGPAGICSLADGKVRFGHYGKEDWVGRGTHEQRPDLVRSAAALQRRTVSQYIEEHPDVVLQLSGGLDSRVQLAAVPSGLRSRLRALTLCERGSKDADIALRLATTNNLDHRMLSLDPIVNLDPEASYALVRTAAIKYNCSGDPISYAILDWAEKQLGQEPRIHGAGGEFARAFYYPGQRQHDAVSSRLVDRLARWRLFLNDAVDPGCLGPSRAEWAREVTLGLLREIFTEYRTDWLTATDSFYLYERMARWAGLQLSVAAVERTLLGSLMHPEFVELARECPPNCKRSSHFMALILRELDPGLARLPLDSGYIPTNLATANIASRLQSSKITGRKVVHKVHQRLSHSSKSIHSAGWLTQNVLEYWRSKPGLLDGLACQEMIDGDWLSQVLAGRLTTNAATVGFLMNLQIIEELRGLFMGGAVQAKVQLGLPAGQAAAFRPQARHRRARNRCARCPAGRARQGDQPGGGESPHQPPPVARAAWSSQHPGLRR